MCLVHPDDQLYRRLQVQDMDLTFRYLPTPVAKNGVVIVELLASASNIAAIYDVLKQAGQLAPDRRPVFVIGINASTAGPSKVVATLPTLRGNVVTALRENQLAGGCVSFTFNPTTNATAVGAYPFPYFEARALLSLHPGAIELRRQLYGWDAIFVRTMDVDGANDPFLTKGINPQLWVNLFRKNYGLVSGGYKWSSTVVLETQVDLSIIPLTTCLDVLNSGELRVRSVLCDRLGPRAIYWPEPNLYSEVSCHDMGARAMAVAAEKLGNDQGQIKESTFFVIATLDQSSKMTGCFNQDLAVEKPIKDGYLRDFFVELVDAHKQLLAGEDEAIVQANLSVAIQSVRQTHFSPGNVESILEWHQSSSFGLKSEIRDIVEPIRTDCAHELLEALKTNIGPAQLEEAKGSRSKNKRKEKSKAPEPQITLVSETVTTVSKLEPIEVIPVSKPEAIKVTPKSQKLTTSPIPTTSTSIGNKKRGKSKTLLTEKSPSQEETGSSQVQMPVCINAPTCNAGSAPTAPRTFAWVFWNWHRCATCSAYYCPYCGDKLPTVSMLRRTRRCTVENCGGTTELY